MAARFKNLPGRPFRPARPSLADKLIDYEMKSKFGDSSRKFIIHGTVAKLVTLQAIQDELEVSREDGALVQWIQEKAPKVFLATICTYSSSRKEAREAMLFFKQNGYDDEVMESDDPESCTDRANEYFPSFVLGLRNSETFAGAKDQLTAPVFDVDKLNYHLHENAILPFIERGSGPDPAAGSFGTVYPVRIHAAHCKNGFPELIAIKEMKPVYVDKSRESIRTNTQRYWDDEARSLKTIKGLRGGRGHPHIIRYLGSIRRGDGRYFMFPWSKVGSLRHFWAQTDKHYPKPGLVLQAITQMLGVAQALSLLHDPNADESTVAHRSASSSDRSIRHGDIKPENLIWIESDADRNEMLLTIADMGLAKQHLIRTKQRDLLNFASTSGSSTRQYEAPESLNDADKHGRGARSRLYDIWSMGCVLLEYTIWLLYGNSGLDSFLGHLHRVGGKDCQFFQELTSDAGDNIMQVSPVVLAWITAIIKEHPEFRDGSSALRDLLELAWTRLLVVNIPSKSTGINSNQSNSNFLETTNNRHIDGAVRGPKAKREVSAGVGSLEQAQYWASQLAVASVAESMPHAASNQEMDIVASTETSKSNVSVDVGLPEQAQCRATAAELCDALEKILHRAMQKDKSSPRYLVLNPDHSWVAPPVSNNGVESLRLRRDATEIRANYNVPQFLDDWQFITDNSFAERVLRRRQKPLPQSSNPVPSTFCSQCEALDFHKPGFSTFFTVRSFGSPRSACKLCNLFQNMCEEHEKTVDTTVEFIKRESTLKIAGGRQMPIFSILSTSRVKNDREVQVGLPPARRYAESLLPDLMVEWLDDCHINHPDCRPKETNGLPTRLIRVGNNKESVIQLVTTSTEGLRQDTPYIALSHPWGDTKKYKPFCTYIPGLESSLSGVEYNGMRADIELHRLPQTFKDAVEVTRRLGVGYLWIDSICIIQGKGGDFETEASKMQNVFSGAHCVIAASSARSQHDGFLEKERTFCDYVEFQGAGASPIYICQGIDDFSRDVEKCHLSSRGWVLQERALARRTIFFSETQAYFECGEGIRCESLTKMKNPLAGLIGDPHFPGKTLETGSKGFKIVHFQNLFRRYSDLSFSYPADRAIAMAGLETRLQESFNTSGAFGVFGRGPDGGFFHRSLLWKRYSDVNPLVAIKFDSSRSRRAPSWSWMAYIGPIDYIRPPFDKTKWSRDIRSPWTSDSNGHRYISPEMMDNNVESEVTLIPATVRSCRLGHKKHQHFDQDLNPTWSDYNCVVVGKKHSDGEEHQKEHYVLFVKARPDLGHNIFQRIGAGTLTGSQIALGGSGSDGYLC